MYGTMVLPSPRSFSARRSPARSTFEEYAPASPRSDVTSSIAARSTFAFSRVSGWSSLEYVATADTARVIARAYGVDACVRCCALIIREAAMSSNALVIFCVDFTARMRLRYSRSWPAMNQPASAASLPDDALLVDVLGVHRVGRLVAWPDGRRGRPATDEVALELLDRAAHRLLRVLPELPGLADRREDVALAPQVLEELALEPPDVLHREVVDQPAGAREDGDDLLLHRVRRVLPLLEELHQAGPAGQLGSGGGVEVGGEHGERLERSELRQVHPERARDFPHGLRLRRAADAGDRDADVDRGPDVGVEQVGLEEDLTVGDGDDVRRDVGRDVVPAGLDEGQAGHRAPAHLVAELGAALEQPAVQVEDVTGVRLAARRAAQQQRDGAVGVGLLREVVEDDEDVLAGVHPVLAERGAGVRGQVLEAGGVVRRSRDDRRVLHGAVLLQRRPDAGDRRALLADGEVDAAHLQLGVARRPVGLLVDDRVDRDRRLAGLPVADDELALATTDRRHRVDRLDARHQRLLDALPLHDGRRLELQRPPGLGLDVAEAVDRIAQRVDHAAEEAVADGHREDLAGAPDLLALLDAAELAEDDDADLTDVQVQRQAKGAVLEAQQLVGHDAGQALHAGDPVAGLADPPDLLAGRGRGVVGLDEGVQGVPDLLGTDRQLRHGGLPCSLCLLAMSSRSVVFVAFRLQILTR